MTAPPSSTLAGPRLGGGPREVDEQGLVLWADVLDEGGRGLCDLGLHDTNCTGFAHIVG